MSIRSLTQRVAGIAFLLALLTACGGGGDINFNNENPGFGGFGNWPWPNNPDFIAEQEASDDVRIGQHIRLRLEAINGQISITGQPDATSVMVSARLRVGSNENQEDAEEGLDQLEVVVTDQADEVLVQTQQPEDNEGRQYVVEYTITVPNDLEMDVSQLNGNISIADMSNSVFVIAVNGNIDTTASLPPDGEVKLSTVNGNIDLNVPTSTSADVSAIADNGTITWDNLNLMDIEQTNRALRGTLGDGDGIIRLETANGDISLIGLDE